MLTFLADPNGQNPAAWYTQLHHPLSSGLLHLHLWVDKQFWGSFSVKLDLNTGRTEIEIPVLKKKIPVSALEELPILGTDSRKPPRKPRVRVL